MCSPHVHSSSRFLFHIQHYHPSSDFYFKSKIFVLMQTAESYIGMDQHIDCLLSLNKGHYHNVYWETNGGMPIFVMLNIRSKILHSLDGPHINQRCFSAPSNRNKFLNLFASIYNR